MLQPESTMRCGAGQAVFSPMFIQHRGERILRIDFSKLEAKDLAIAADQVRRIVTAEPPRSVRTLTILFTRLTAPHIRARALVGPSFWRALGAVLQARGREEIMMSEDEAAALDWLASR